MAVSLTRFSCWLWSAKNKEKECVDFVKLRTNNLSSAANKVKRKWQSREERRLDKEYDGDAVLVGSDGEIELSGSESDGPDWSIGWVEPHGIGFTSDEDGFAVLVPCYKKLAENNSNNLFLSAIKNLPTQLSSGNILFIIFLNMFYC